MKKIITTFSLATVCTISIFGQTILYNYNQGGACTSRVLGNNNTRGNNGGDITPDRIYDTDFSDNIISISMDDGITLNLSNPVASGNLGFILCDLSGRIINQGILNSSHGSVHISGISDGIYILRISGTDFSNTYKLIKNRP